MKKPRSKRTQKDREEYLARKKIKAEIKARPPAPIPEELRGVHLREVSVPHINGDLGIVLSMMLAMKAARNMRRERDFWGPVRRKVDV